jgi:hypothetical protein
MNEDEVIKKYCEFKRMLFAYNNHELFKYINESVKKEKGIPRKQDA